MSNKKQEVKTITKTEVAQKPVSTISENEQRALGIVLDALNKANLRGAFDLDYAGLLTSCKNVLVPLLPKK